MFPCGIVLCSRGMHYPMTRGILSRMRFARRIYSYTGTWPSKLEPEHWKKAEEYWKPILRSSVRRRNTNHLENKKVRYVLSMFPYPSGRLHMGHVRVYTISDALARYFSYKDGASAFHPMGFDAFGLPAENAALEQNKNPSQWTNDNIDFMRDQLDSLGLLFDWNDPPVKTCDPSNYYSWTQWIFLKMYEKGLAYKKTSFVNWDPIDRTVLADEQVDCNGYSWRSGALVEKRMLKQWFLKTTEYAEDLYNGLDSDTLANWGDIKAIQKHWIGQCNGIRISYLAGDEVLSVWTSDPPAFLHSGVAFIAISHENILSDMPTKTVKNPFTQEMIPLILIDNPDLFPEGADAFVGIPDLHPEHADLCLHNGIMKWTSVLNSDDTIINSGKKLDGLSIEESSNIVIQMAKNLNVGGKKTSSKLNDWLISRQRYWGTPIPIIYCNTCGTVPVSEQDLPVTLPDIKELKMGGERNGESPLSAIHSWVNTNCPKCGSKDAKRETDTMDTFVDSSWYFLRYLDSKNQSNLVKKELCERYMPVDLYVGGKEHAVLHLFFARFVTRFLYDIGISSVQEPFRQLLVQGLVKSKSYRLKSSGKYLKADEIDFSGEELKQKETGESVEAKWEKMSKSKHNGVEPRDIINKYGCDATRLLILADVNPKSDRLWSEDSINRINSLSSRMWSLVHQSITIHDVKTSKQPLSEFEYLNQVAKLCDARNYYIKTLSFSYEVNHNLSMVISRIHGLLNELWKSDFRVKKMSGEFQHSLGCAIIMLSPLAPHFCSELWAGLSSTKVKNTDKLLWEKPLFEQKWPSIDSNYNINLKITKNGKKKIASVPVSFWKLEKLQAEDAFKLCSSLESVQKEVLCHEHFSYVLDKKSDADVVLDFKVIPSKSPDPIEKT